MDLSKIKETKQYKKTGDQIPKSKGFKTVSVGFKTEILLSYCCIQISTDAQSKIQSVGVLDTERYWTLYPVSILVQRAEYWKNPVLFSGVYYFSWVFYFRFWYFAAGWWIYIIFLQLFFTK